MRIAGRVTIFFECAGAFLRAWRIKCVGNMGSVVFDEVRAAGKPLGDDIAFLLACADRLVHVCGLWTGRKCFLRSYVLVSVLRRHGEEAELNIGMRNLGAKADISGHCWVTLPDRVALGESGGLWKEYPVLMGESGRGVRYWAGLSDSQGGGGEGQDSREGERSG